MAGAPPEGLVDTFFELLSNGGPSDFQRIVDLKVRGRRQCRTACVAPAPAASACCLPPAPPACQALGTPLPRLRLCSSRNPVTPLPFSTVQVLKRVEYQMLLEQFNRLMGRPVLSGGDGGAASSGVSASAGGGGVRAMKSKSLRFMSRDGAPPQ